MVTFCIAMLKWFVEDNVARAALEETVLVQEEEVEVRPECIPDAVMDENVDIHLIRRFFSHDAWLVMEDTLSRKRRNFVYLCRYCAHDVHESVSVACDCCLLWFHLKCVGLKKEPKQKYWFCRQCCNSH